MKYFLFLDESGDHGLTKLNPDFPVFLLCGVLVTAENYEIIRQELNKVKQSIWGEKKVIFHSRDIRKCEKEFQVLFDLELKKFFYENINTIVGNSDYTIIASAIQKRYLLNNSEELRRFSPTFTFRNKKENINGLQLADLVAYPIARFVIEQDRANPAFDILKEKIYKTNGQLDGLKIYP